jgi:hypothetical protein
MPAARYWRISGVVSYATLGLAVTTFKLRSAGADLAVTPTAQPAPVAGSTSTLYSGGGLVEWTAAQVGGRFTLSWDLGAEIDVNGIAVSAPSVLRFPACLELSCSPTGEVWTPAYDFPIRLSYTEGAETVWDVTAASYYNSVLGMAPAVYWPMNDASGLTVLDHSGNGVNGTLTSTTEVTFGAAGVRVGGASMGFGVVNATTSNINSTHASLKDVFNANVNGTILLWVKPTNTGFSNRLLAYSWNPGNPNLRYMLAAGPNWNGDNADGAQLNGWSFHAAQGTAYTPAPLGAGVGTTSFIAIRTNYTEGRVRITVNGTTAQSASFNPVGPGDGAGSMFYLPFAANWNYYPVRGYISDFALFHRELTDTEVENLYSVGRYGGLTPASFVTPLGRHLTTQAMAVSSFPVGNAGLRGNADPTFSDVQDGGTLTLAGTVRRVGDPSDVPLRRRVRLYHERDRRFIREVWSDATTGAFAFLGLKDGGPYTAFAYDHTNAYRALVLDRFTGVAHA